MVGSDSKLAATFPRTRCRESLRSELYRASALIFESLPPGNIAAAERLTITQSDDGDAPRPTVCASLGVDSAIASREFCLELLLSLEVGFEKEGEGRGRGRCVLKLGYLSLVRCTASLAEGGSLLARRLQDSALGDFFGRAGQSRCPGVAGERQLGYRGIGRHPVWL